MTGVREDPPGFPPRCVRGWCRQLCYQPGYSVAFVKVNRYPGARAEPSQSLQEDLMMMSVWHDQLSISHVLLIVLSGECSGLSIFFFFTFWLFSWFFFYFTKCPLLHSHLQKLQNAPQDTRHQPSLFVCLVSLSHCRWLQVVVLWCESNYLISNYS